MAADIENEFGYKSELVAGSGGVFKITADETVLFSKHDADNEFPAEGVVVAAVKEYQESLA